MVIVEGTILREKFIKGYDGRYSVREDGEVISYIKSGHNKEGYKVLKHYIDKDGYHRVALWKDRKPKNFIVSRLVAEYFVPNPNNYPQVDHIDCNKDNNSYNNLEWVTLEENVKRSYKNKLHKLCEESPQAKLTNEQVRWIRKNFKKGDNEFGCRPLSRKFKVSKTCIKYIIERKTYKEVE